MASENQMMIIICCIVVFGELGGMIYHGIGAMIGCLVGITAGIIINRRGT